MDRVREREREEERLKSWSVAKLFSFEDHTQGFSSGFILLLTLVFFVCEKNLYFKKKISLKNLTSFS